MTNQEPQELDNEHHIHDCPVCGASDSMAEKQVRDFELSLEASNAAAVREVLLQVRDAMTDKNYIQTANLVAELLRESGDIPEGGKDA